MRLAFLLNFRWQHRKYGKTGPNWIPEKNSFFKIVTTNKKKNSFVIKYQLVKN